MDRAASRLVLADAGLLTAFRIFDPRGFLGLGFRVRVIELFAIESTEKYRLILAEFQNYKKIMFKLVRENNYLNACSLVPH